MQMLLRHRGPDDAGTWSDHRLVLAHNRLAIVDLVDSRQPMVSAASDAVVCFNGEILNYRQLRDLLPGPFKTDGDTEVILAAHRAWGDGAAERFRGQFSYAHYRPNTGELALVRDAAGILPLYWWSDGRRLVFASELSPVIRAIGTLPPIDREALAEYLQSRFVTAPRTLLEGVRKVRPGHILRVDRDGQISESSWGGAPAVGTERRFDVEQTVDEFDSLITRAVERTLVADVPVGTFLSGGVDSSLITAKVMQSMSHTHTYCAAFGDPRTDESHHAMLVARHLGTKHTTVEVRPRDFQENWARLSLVRGAPMSEPADVAVFLLAKEARRDVKVVLSGEGSDELFAGYPKHRFARMTKWAGLAPGGVRSGMALLEQRLPASGRRASIALRALSQPTYESRVAGWFASFTFGEVKSFGLPVSDDNDGLHSSNPLRAMLVHDLGGWLSDNLLERGDRMTMASSLEIRPPFLDRDLVDFSAQLPTSLLIRRGVRKWLVKETARRYVPASVIDRPKVGFKVPLDSWFRDGLWDLTSESLLDSSSVSCQFVPRDIIETMLREHRLGTRDHAVKIWTLASLEVWYQGMRSEYGVASPIR